ncbi:MAG: hypothetical protein N4A47_00620 [Clostridia bacterium]|nr:hypothetical protein [Clostridia bacterium]
MTLEEMQKRAYENKINKGFNVTNVEHEFCMMHGEMAEAYEAYTKNKDDLGEELADVAIFLLGLSEILGYNLHDEITNKMDKNEKRVYKEVEGLKIKLKVEE